MLPETQKLAAKKYLEIAIQVEQELEKETNELKKTALRMVSGQNYFYAGIEAIEAVLKKNGITVEDHKDRIRKIELNYRLFKNADNLLIKHKLVTQEGLNYRRRVGYRGENGNKFITLKEFALAAMEEIVVKENLKEEENAAEKKTQGN